MTVEQLIKHLLQFSPECEVGIYSEELKKTVACSDVDLYTLVDDSEAVILIAGKDRLALKES